MNRIFNSSLGYMLDLDRLILVKEPYFANHYGNGGYYLQFELVFQLSGVCTSIADASLTVRIKLAASDHHEPPVGALLIDGTKVEPSKLLKEQLRSLQGCSGCNVALFWAGYDELVAAWRHQHHCL